MNQIPRMLSPNTLKRIARRRGGGSNTNTTENPIPNKENTNERPPRSATARDVVEELIKKRNLPKLSLENQIYASTLLERTPMIMRDREEWELAFMDIVERKKNDQFNAALEALGGKQSILETIYMKTWQQQQGTSKPTLEDWVSDILNMGRSNKPRSSSTENSSDRSSKQDQQQDQQQLNDTNKQQSPTTPPPDDSIQSAYKAKIEASTSKFKNLGIELDDAPIQIESLASTNTYESKRKQAAVTSAPETRTSNIENDKNRQSLDRKMQESIYFVVKGKDDVKWRLPHSLLNKGETMLETAKKGLLQTLLPESKIHFVSQAPIGQTLNFGFLYRALVLKSNTIKLSPNIKDYAWLTRRELAQELGQGDSNEIAYWLMLTDVGQDFDPSPENVLEELFKQASESRSRKREKKEVGGR
jgi:hypothetical protein